MLAGGGAPNVPRIDTAARRAGEGAGEAGGVQKRNRSAQGASRARRQCVTRSWGSFFGRKAPGACQSFCCLATCSSCLLCEACFAHGTAPTQQNLHVRPSAADMALRSFCAERTCAALGVVPALKSLLSSANPQACCHHTMSEQHVRLACNQEVWWGTHRKKIVADICLRVSCH